jgi:hypothetical protein
MPDPTYIAAWQILGTLPTLKTIVAETIKLGNPAMNRLQLIEPAETLVYDTLSLSVWANIHPP